MSATANHDIDSHTEPKTQGPESAASGRRSRKTGDDAGWTRGIFRGVRVALAVVFVAVIALGFVVPRLLGAVPMAVLTGSMEPTYSPGDLVVSQPAEPEEIRVGDVVTFQPESADPALVTHRVIAKSLGADGVASFTTQGDANGAADEPIVPEQIQGKVIYSVPYLGYLTTALGPDAKAIGAGLIGLGLLGYALYSILGAARSKSRKSRADSTS